MVENNLKELIEVVVDGIQQKKGKIRSSTQEKKNKATVQRRQQQCLVKRKKK